MVSGMANAPLQSDALPCLIRPMTSDDLPACAQIERSAGDPWSFEQLEQELASQRAGGAARLFVAEQGGVPVGLAAFQLAAGEASLYTLTVAPTARRGGVGRALLLQSLVALQAERAEACFLEVRAQNMPALALYEALGFVRAGLRRGFYQNPPDDAVVMSRAL